MRSWFAMLLIALGAAPVEAAPAALCEGVNAGAGEPDATAVAVFPSKARSKADDCIAPLERLRYGDADVLFTKRGGPDCHGCGARLSAFVLLRTPSGPKVVARFIDFAEIGSSGQAGGFTAIQLDGHDAFGVSGGGTFQGYTSETISFFVFRDRRLDTIKPALPLSADNGGSVGDDKATRVDGAWHVDPGIPARITVDYRIKADGKTRGSSATWRLEGSTLKPVSGRIPDEYQTASGN